jgi:hypothetical protein
MAAFYGRLRGDRGEATRCGSKGSGMTAIAETWQGQARVDLSGPGEYVFVVSDKGSASNGLSVSGNVGDNERSLQVGPMVAEIQARNVREALAAEGITLEPAQFSAVVEALSLAVLVTDKALVPA